MDRPRVRYGYKTVVEESTQEGPNGVILLMLKRVLSFCVKQLSQCEMLLGICCKKNHLDIFNIHQSFCKILPIFFNGKLKTLFKAVLLKTT